MATCRTCGAPIKWVFTASGRRMPIDELPVSNGNIMVNGNQARYVQPSINSSAYVSHFTTCPNADEHRRKK